MNPITNDTVLEFIRMLVNMGNIDFLKEPEMVILDKEGNTRMVKEGDKTKPIQLLMSGIVKDDNYFLYNPLKIVEGSNPASNWFWNSRCNNVAMLTQGIMAKVIQLGATKDMENYETLSLITEINDVCDEQLQKELFKINIADLLRFVYNKRFKTCEAQTLIFSDEAEQQYKLRKRSWTALRKIFRTIFGIGEEETTLSKYTYRATILSIPEIDARLHVIGNIITALEPWAKLINVELEAEKFNEHLKNLETYARMYAWFTARSVNGTMVVSNQSKNEQIKLPTSEQKDDTVIKIPTNTLTPPPQSIPMPMGMGMPMGAPMGVVPGFAPPMPPMQPVPFGQPMMGNPYAAGPMTPQIVYNSQQPAPIKVDNNEPDHIRYC